MSTTVRLGSSCGPSETPAEGIMPNETDEMDVQVEREDCDPNTLLQCPFDKSHQIRACRFSYHLIKCKKNHLELANQLKTCPFNARHLIPKAELARHIATCVDKRPITGWGDEEKLKWQVPVSTWINTNTSEDWDEEADEHAAPFVWGVSTSFDQTPDTSTTNLKTRISFRPPNTLPWGY